MSSPPDSKTTTKTTILPSATGPRSPGLQSVPEQLGDFVIVRKLGEGAFGQVYLANQTSLGRLVALKLTRSSETCGREGQLLAGLEHDHIVKVFSEFFDHSTQTRGLCLQYIPGTNLGVLIQSVYPGIGCSDCSTVVLSALDQHSKGDISFDPASLRDRELLGSENFAQTVCRLGARLAEALAFAHDKGVLHCDIKPANILLTPYGRPMLADFNVAFDRTRTGEMDPIGGTLAYTAPEHAAALRGLPGGRVDERSDIYSLGVVLQELCTGTRPDSCDPFAEPALGKRPDLLERVPRELASVIRRCLSREASERYQTANELARALMGAWHLLATQRSLPLPRAVGRWTISHPTAALAIAAVGPHVVGTLANIGYNAVEVHLSQEQQHSFSKVVMAYNSIAYPVLLGITALYIWSIHKGLKEFTARPCSAAIARTRRLVQHWGWWTLALGVVGWLPGGLVFPVSIDLMSGPVPRETYFHFLVSFTLAGLISVVFSYLLSEYVIFRALLPRLCNPDRDTPAGIWKEFAPLTALFAPCLILACAVPLTGAVLLVILADGAMTLGFRLLVTVLIGLGVAGVGAAERLIRKLRGLCGVWEREGSWR